MEQLTIEISVASWHTVDAALDNAGAVARTSGAFGGATVDARCARIREVGWQAARSHQNLALGSLGWPPLCDQLAISLERDDWAFVLAEVERWSTWERDDDPAARFERELRARVG